MSRSHPAGDRHRFEPQPFGFFRSLDLYGCKEGVCDDVGLCYDFLEESVVVLGMTKQSPPFVFRSDHQKFPEKAGISAWVPLIESGVQLHTLSIKRFVSIDLYSCRYFEKDGILELAKRYFDYSESESDFILRGVKYNDIV